MMKVFKLAPDFAFQTFHTSDPNNSRDGEEEYLLDGKSKLSTWKPLPIFEADPGLELGNFAYCWDGGFVVDTSAAEVLKPILEQCAELLPLKGYKSRAYHLLNVLNCPDCLDEQRTKWRVGKKNKTRFAIEEYAFMPEKLPDSTLFRIPKNVALFTVVDHPNSSAEFKKIVEREGLTGLKFDEVWSEDGRRSRRKDLVKKC